MARKYWLSEAIQSVQLDSIHEAFPNAIVSYNYSVLKRKRSCIAENTGMKNFVARKYLHINIDDDENIQWIHYFNGWFVSYIYIMTSKKFVRNDICNPDNGISIEHSNQLTIEWKKDDLMPELLNNKDQIIFVNKDDESIHKIPIYKVPCKIDINYFLKFYKIPYEYDFNFFFK